MMINIALVEDEDSAAKVMLGYLNRFTSDKGVKFNTVRFSDAVGFLANYNSNFDIVLMDIEMPDLSGMEAARKLREIDKTVILIFVTNMAQFAVKGYEVDAMDFIVKPVDYFVFSVKLGRALDRVTFNRDVKLRIKTENGVVNLLSSKIKYIESVKHLLIFYTTDGEFRSYGTLKETEAALSAVNFVRCNSCYLVNLRYVNCVHGYTVTVDGEELLISHPKRKDFVKSLNDYLGSGNV